MIPHPLFFTPAGGSSGQGVFLLLWYGLGFGGIFYFFVIRPERQRRKQHQDMVAAVKKGDEVTTTGGIIGEIVQIKEDRVTIRSHEAKLHVHKDHITHVKPGKGEGASS